MYTASTTAFDDFFYSGLRLTDVNKNFANGAHTTQHFRANLRATNPPHMFLDDASLAAGLEGSDLYMMDHEPRTPQPSPPYTETCSCYLDIKENEGTLQQDDREGTISPLELPPRLLNFELADRDNSDSLLLGSEPSLDLEELDRRLKLTVRAEEPQEVNFDRRLESIARIERLQKAGLLDAFFAFANTAPASSSCQ